MEVFIKVKNNLVIFPREDNALLRVFQHFCTVDLILIEGDWMYFNALESESI